MLIDTHCHLYDAEAFPDPEAVVDRAAAAGVDRMIVVGIDTATSHQAIALADRFAGVFATVGWHPTNTARWNASEHAEVASLTSHPKVVAVGEIGLDYHWDYATPDQQMAALIPQIDLAQEVGLPIVWHCRDAYPHLLEVLEAAPPGPNVFHCFAGDESEADRALAIGSFFGVDGPITYKKAEATRAIFARLPRDRVVVETDAPYLTPVPHRGKKNEPAYVAYVAQQLAEVWGISLDEVAALTSSNAERLFPKLTALQRA